VGIDRQRRANNKGSAPDYSQSIATHSIGPENCIFDFSGSRSPVVLQRENGAHGIVITVAQVACQTLIPAFGETFFDGCGEQQPLKKLLFSREVRRPRPTDLVSIFPMDMKGPLYRFSFEEVKRVRLLKRWFHVNSCS
jgi:hypothetical protein